MRISKLHYILAFIISEPFSQLYRRRILKQLESDWSTNSQFYLQFQEKRLEKVFKSALQTNYYKELKKNEILPPKPEIWDFPIITKADIQKRSGAFKQSNFFTPRSYQNTGGSTGEPLHFSVSLDNKHLELIHQTFFYRRLGVKNNDLIVSIDGVNISQKNVNRNIFWKYRVPNFPFGAYRFSASVLNNQNVACYVRKIKNLKPSIIRSYPSALVILAKYILRNKILRDFQFLKGIMVTSEVISEENLALFSKAFLCPILPQYGMTESCAFAFTTPNSLKYYCSPYYGITEVLNEKGQMVKEGEIGELVLTSLGNIHHPFIRYKTGDYAEYGGSHNGFVILNRILGRTQDYIVDTNNNKYLLIGIIFGSHNKIFSKILMWQIIQEKCGEIEIKLDVSEDWHRSDETSLYKVFEKIEPLKIYLNYTNEFHLTRSGKRKFLVQLIPNDEKSRNYI